MSSGFTYLNYDTYDNFENLVLIDKDVQYSDLFFTSVNNSSLPISFNICYNNDVRLVSHPFFNGNVSEIPVPINEPEPYISQKEILTNIISSKNLTNLKRLCIVANNVHISGHKHFLDYNSYFNDNDLIDGVTIFSENLTFLINFIKQFNIINIDFLMCNALQYPKWVKYFEILTRETGVIVGASNDATGNIRYGGDWIMESTNQDIKNIYFTENIDDYTDTLVGTVIVRSATIISATQYYYNDDPTNILSIVFPISIGETGTTGTKSTEIIVKLNADITLSGVDSYFIYNRQYVVFDGDNHTITINNTPSYNGLIYNGVGSGSTDSYANTITKNVTVSTSGSTTLSYQNGWITRRYFGCCTDNHVVDNCHSTGNLTTERSAGICGSYFCNSSLYYSTYNSTTQKYSYTWSITNCTSTGNMYHINYGIVGIYPGNSTTGLIKNCSATGTMLHTECSAIAGHNAGNFSHLTIENCFSSGDIAYDACTGIVSSNPGTNGYLLIKNCNVRGNITGTYCAGIAGGWVGNNGTLIIDNCYITGNVGGLYSAGICSDIINLSNNFEIKNSFVTGNINGTSCGGICSDYYPGAASGVVNITNCFSTGTVSSTCGGIFGINGSRVNITNCYSIGTLLAGNSSTSTTFDEINAHRHRHVVNSYCEANNGSSVWNETNAITYLIVGDFNVSKYNLTVITPTYIKNWLVSLISTLINGIDLYETTDNEHFKTIISTYSSPITSIKIGTNVTALDNSYFKNHTALSSVNFSISGCTSIPFECFKGCSALTSVVLSNIITSFGNNCFSNCSALTSINFPTTLTSLPEACFRYCGFTTLTIPSNINNLGDYCFANCSNLHTVTINNSTIKLGNYCFANGGLISFIVL